MQFVSKHGGKKSGGKNTGGKKSGGKTTGGKKSRYRIRSRCRGQLRWSGDRPSVSAG